MRANSPARVRDSGGQACRRQRRKKIALVTGANKGLGLETARQLARAGLTVLMAARDAAKGQPAVDQLKGEGLDVQFIQLDVGNERTAPTPPTLSSRTTAGSTCW